MNEVQSEPLDDMTMIMLKHIQAHEGGEDVKSLRESMRDQYVVKLLHEIWRELLECETNSETA